MNRRFVLTAAISITWALGAVACGPETGINVDTPTAEEGRTDTETNTDEPVVDPDGNRVPSAGTAKGPFPFVLMHGIFGFDKIGPLDGFYGVEAALTKEGHQVFSAKVDPVNDSTTRGDQLLIIIDQVLQKTGAARVNIIAHSQGGLGARYAAYKQPAKVASVVTIGTPHQGAVLADLVLQGINKDTVTVAETLFKMMGKPFFGSIVEGSDIQAALVQLSAARMTAFNAQITDQPNTKYYSISGRTGYVSAAKLCAKALNPPFIAKWSKLNDTPEVMFLLTGLALRGSLLAPEPHDGVVQLKGTPWGTWLGCIPADHYDEIGQPMDQATAGGFDHLEFYRDLTSYLRKQGL
jgi:triacylglycerol lipase